MNYGGVRGIGILSVLKVKRVLSMYGLALADGTLTQVCTCCKVEKPLTEFYELPSDWEKKGASFSRPARSWCKDCRAKQQKELLKRKQISNFLQKIDDKHKEIQHLELQLNDIRGGALIVKSEKAKKEEAHITNIINSPAWIQLKAVIVAELKPYPEAKVAILAALKLE